MDLPGALPLRTDFALKRASAFAYRCGACNRCCRHKSIPVNPYEVARLAQTLGTSTTDVLARFTRTGGASLAARPDGACVFLGEGGCGVHAGRPLACRLYPLGRRLLPDGDEAFAEVVPHPQSAGVYGRDGTHDGTVADWLESQGAGPYIEAADRYVAILRRMVDALARSEDVGDVAEEATAAMARAPVPEDESWLDMDAVVARRCAARGEPVPSDVAAKTEIHMAALEEMLARYDSAE